MTRVLTALLSLTLASAQTKPDRPEPGPVSLRELSLSLEHLSERVHRAVVQVFSTAYAAPSKDDSDSGSAAGLLAKQRATGSGVIISPDGYIVTNNHVVRSARRIQVRLPASRDTLANMHSIVKPEGPLLDAKLVGTDRESDIAAQCRPAVTCPTLRVCNLHVNVRPERTNSHVV